MRRYSEDEEHDMRMEFGRGRRRGLSCSDRMCGADDCELCHPENFIDDEQHEEECDE